MHLGFIDILVSSWNIKEEESIETMFDNVSRRLPEIQFILESAAKSPFNLRSDIKPLKTVCDCLLTVYTTVKEDRFSISLLEHLKKHENRVVDVMSLILKEDNDHVRDIIRSSYEVVPRIVQNLTSMTTVLGIVESMTYDELHKGYLRDHMTFLQETGEKMKTGKISLDEYRKLPLMQLEGHCSTLNPFVMEVNKYQPKLFWVLNRENLQQYCTENYNKDISSGIMQYLATVCTTQYKEFMGKVMDSSANLKHTLDVFGCMTKADMESELRTFHYVYNHKEDVSESPIMRVCCLDDVYSKAKAVQKLQEKFSLEHPDDLQSKFDCIYNLYENKLVSREEETISSFSLFLEQVRKDILYFDADFCRLLHALSESRDMVDFLREIKDEDIRNLLDAAEGDHFDQYLPVVAHLIEIKDLLYPLIDHMHTSENAQTTTCISVLHDSFLKTNVKLAANKCSECSRELHNLKDFYKTFENRTEKTKDKIRSITRQCTVTFELHAHSCVFKIRSDENNVTYSMSETNDLRSRALLIQSRFEKSSEGNSSIYSDDLFRSFLRIVDMTSKISDMFIRLSCLGHPLYIDCEKNLSLGELQDWYNIQKSHAENWEMTLANCRLECNVINFIKSEQLPIVYMYLISGLDEENALSVLQFLGSDMETKLRGSRMLVDDWDPTNYIEDPARVLNAIIHDLESMYQNSLPVEKSTDSIFPPSITRLHTFKNRNINFLRIEKGSPSVIPTILSLFVKGSNRLPICNQILLCNESTSWDEIYLLLQRCNIVQKLKDPMFCIAFTELLPVDVQFQLARELREYDIEEPSVLFVLYRGKETDTFPTVFKDCEISVEPLSRTDISELFHSLFPNVRVFSSELPGQGKTEVIKDLAAEELCGVRTVQISGSVDRIGMIKQLRDSGVKSFHYLHLDVGLVEKPDELDSFIFELVVLGYVSSTNNCYALSSNKVAIEIASTIKQTLLSELPLTTCFEHVKLRWQDLHNFQSQTASGSATQIVCQYLQKLDLDCFEEDVDIHTSKTIDQEKCRNLLRKYFKVSEESSFTQLNIFLMVLSSQLKKMTVSSFFQYSHLHSMAGDEAGNLKKQVIETMIAFSNEFASRSVTSCRSSQTHAVVQSGVLGATETTLKALVSRTKGMIRWESSNHLVLIFHEDFQTVSALYRNLDIVPENIGHLFATQINRPLQDFLTMKPAELLNILVRISRPAEKWLTADETNRFITSYALTPDNMLKMVLILLRMQASMPVVVMGETGCGKTSLIRRLAQICDTDLEIFGIHAGITDLNIVKKIQAVNDRAKSDFSKPMWLFLDEINTSEHIGLLGDIVCHHQLSSQNLAPNLHLLAACNPYRLRNANKIYSTGLRGKIREDRLSPLAYRVHPLPESMIDYVWDYGALPQEEEKTYIERMVKGMDIFRDVWDIFVAMLTNSQQFVREKEGSACTVSLRDVERCKTLAKWFHSDFLKHFAFPSKSTKHDQVNAILLALMISYQNRFPENQIRKAYRERLSAICAIFTIPYSAEEIYEVTKNVQESILEKMDIPTGVARNTALQENVFLILVCILNKIPLFLVGKPGCSKSLSMQLIRNNMRGPDSKDALFKAYPRLYYASFQGSESSTSDGISKVFDRARRYQTEDRNVISLVILDEVGLAEISRFNPLKVLHSLLEPDGSLPDVAVVGISNWALDAAKMNRAIHLSRPEMDKDELYQTALSIRKSIDSTISLHDSDRRILTAMAEAYLLYTQNQPILHFHGLRDFYSFVKFVSKSLRSHYDACTSDEKESTYTDDIMRVLWVGILRNFGGLRSHMDIVKDTFKKKMAIKDEESATATALISENIRDPDSRHLMLILDSDVAIGSLNDIINAENRHSTILLGSKFEDDQDDDYNHRALNKIILCMEQPNVLILKDLENIYGSLYDMLNQNYTVVQNKKHCRVALGPFSNPTCEVHDDFKCIVLIDEKNVEFADPPFLNRFEKQQFSIRDSIEYEQSAILDGLTNVVKDISAIGENFTEKDAFAIFGEDFISSLMFASRSEQDENLLIFRCILEILWIMKPDAVLRMSESTLSDRSPESISHLLDLYFTLPIHSGLEFYLSEMCCAHAHQEEYPLSSDEITSKIESILKCYFKSHLVQAHAQCSTDQNSPIVEFDSGDDPEDWKPPFADSDDFGEDTSDSDSFKDYSDNDATHERHETAYRMSNLYQSIIQRGHTDSGKCLAVFTYSTIYNNISDALPGLNHRLLKLGETKSEKHLNEQLNEFWANERDQFLIVQCDTRSDLQHILFAKTAIENSKRDAPISHKTKKNVCILLHISRYTDYEELFSKMNFLSGWPMAMLDTVEKSRLSLRDLREKTIMEVFSRKNGIIRDLIRNEVPQALSTIRYSHGFIETALSETVARIRDCDYAVDVLTDIVLNWIRDNEAASDLPDWQVRAATDKHLIYTSTTMIGSLQTYLSTMIRHPLAMALYKLEDLDVLSTLLHNHSSPGKQTFLEKLLNDESIFNIVGIHKPTGPGCYVIQSRPIHLKVPFIKIYLDKMDSLKDCVLDDLRKANVVPDLLTDQDDLSEIDRTVQSVIKLYIPTLKRDIYSMDIDAYPELIGECYDDICNFISIQFPCQLSDEQRISSTKWVLSKLVDIPKDDVSSFIVGSFIWGWIYSSKLHSVLQLIDLSSDDGKLAIENLQSSQDSKSFIECIEGLLETTCSDILPTERALKELGAQQWQEKVYFCIASLAAMGVTSPTVYTVKLFSDIVSLLFIPYKFPESELCALAAVAGKEGLLSEKTFNVLWDYLERKLHVETIEAGVIQKVFCVFINRSLESNPDSNEVMIFALRAIEKGRIFDKQLQFFGPCIRTCIFDYELEKENAKIPLQTQLFYQILSDKTDLSEIEGDHLMQLINRIIKKDTCPALTILMTDILEKNIYRKLVSIDDVMSIKSRGHHLLQKLASSKTIIKEKDISLQYVCATAYTKTFLCTYIHAFQQGDASDKNLYGAIEHLFSDLDDEDSNNGLERLFMFLLHYIWKKDGVLSITHLQEEIKLLGKKWTKCCFKA